ncbi:FecCD family ABC transporter permease [Leucobacter massiliensis]|uniref:ABC transporter permease n=1 Tax=Leucobacter massiliensis TaxID=1686285 RepID=A0A2S9QRK4_9MICO|nr:iron ABC transporter permease [Leucobacter massiliensis]PRI12202.1 ABC transporter permease [Leucobacter massiliensis]
MSTARTVDRPGAAAPRAGRAAASTIAAVGAARRRHLRRRRLAITGLAIAVIAGFTVTLMVGHTFYGLDEVVPAVLGADVPGASFTVAELRLPRATLAILVGFAFGIAGATFQTMLGNPLASPDILGVSSGAGAAAVFGIVVLGLGDGPAAAFALLGALATAAAIFLLANRGGFVGTRFILVGIGLAAMLQSVTSYMVARAGEWDIQRAMQWLTGSLNGARGEQILTLAIASAVLLPLLFAGSRSLELVRLGPDAATGLGVPVGRVRILMIAAAVALLAFATASAGPVMFVAFMAGPIASRLAGPAGSALLPAGLTGALLVLLADLAGQNLLDGRYPVGVVTGVLGAPYLILLLIRMNRRGQTA